MTRRRGSFFDPTSHRGTPPEALDQLLTALSTLSPRDAGLIKLRWGLEDGEPKTLDEIGLTYGVTRARVRQLIDAAIRKLQDPTLLEALRPFTSDDFARVPAATREQKLGIHTTEEQLVYCSKHRGWFAPEEARRNSRRTCDNCQCLVPAQSNGRRRRYCSSACRQEAYRKRRATEAENRAR